MESQRKYEPSHSEGSAVAAREGGFQYCVNTSREEWKPLVVNVKTLGPFRSEQVD